MSRHFAASGGTNFISLLDPAPVEYPYSVSAWFRPTALDTSNRVLACYGEFAHDTFLARVSYMAASSTRVRGATFGGAYAADYLTTLALNQWNFLAVVWETGAKRTVYLNGSTLTATSTADPGTNAIGNIPRHFSVGGAHNSATTTLASSGFVGDIADVGLWHAILTPADIDLLASGKRPSAVQAANLLGWWPFSESGGLESLAGSLPAFTTYGTVGTAPDPPALDAVYDSASIPDVYVPNEALPWVQRAHHIWALHPSDPLKDDKGGIAGGLTLTLVTGTQPPPNALASPENTMQFHGGAAAASSYYRTVSTFVFGANLAPPDNPPSVGAISCWVYLDAIAGNQTLVGGAPQYYSPLMGVSSAGGIIIDIGNTAVATGPVLTGRWTHLVIQHTAAGNHQVYLNGAKIHDAFNSTWGMSDIPLQIGGGTHAPFTLNGLGGRLRLVALVDADTWTDAEILEQYQRPYAYYAPAGPPPVEIRLGNPQLIVSM